MSATRTFDPPESPIECLEQIWRALGLERAVLVQASAHGSDHSAMIAAIARSPKTRRGVALLSGVTSTSTITMLHHGGVRAVRFNWIKHLLRNDPRTEAERLSGAEKLLEQVLPLGWHVEVHIDSSDLDVLACLRIPPGMILVIDHMARLDVSAMDTVSSLEKLLRLLDSEKFWVKLSGADRVTAMVSELNDASSIMRQIITAAPDRCVWGLDWPHVNLLHQRNNSELLDLLLKVAGDDSTLKQILVHNAAKLYDFPDEHLQDTSYTTGEGK